MPNSPFTQVQSFKEYCQDMEMERQDKFDHRIVDAIFQHGGCPAHVMKFVRKRMQTSGQDCLTIDWFNRNAGFPYFVGTRRFHSSRTVELMLKDLGGTEATVKKMEEVKVLEDLVQASPGMPVVLVSRYAGRNCDYAIHTTWRSELGPPAYTYMPYLIVEPLASFVTAAAEQYCWEPSSYLPVSVGGREE
jgi:hypothetical protein